MNMAAGSTGRRYSRADHCHTHGHYPCRKREILSFSPLPEAGEKNFVLLSIDICKIICYNAIMMIKRNDGKCL